MTVVVTTAVRAVMTGRSGRVLGELGNRSACVARKLAAVTCITAICIAGAAAAEPFAAPKAAESAPATSAGGLAQVTLSLVLVLAVVFAAAWAVRRLRNFGRLGAGAIEIVADVALGTKERAVLVQVGKQQLLLGVAPGRVNTLHVLAEPVQVGRGGAGGPLPVPPPATGGGDVPHGTSSFPPPVGGGRGGDVRPDFKSILKRSLGL